MYTQQREWGGLFLCFEKLQIFQNIKTNPFRDFTPFRVNLLLKKALLTSISKAQIKECILSFGLSDGKITIQVVGGTPSYLYAWSNGQTTPSVTGLPAGAHTVSVTDANGCTLTPITFNVSPAVLLTITGMTPQSPACNAG